MLDMCQECVPEENFPYDMTYLGFTNEYYVLEMAELYYNFGERDKADAILYKFVDSLKKSQKFFREFDNDETSSDTYERINSFLSEAERIYLSDVYDLINEGNDEQALKNLDRAYRWVSLSDLPADTCWYDFVLYYSYLGQSAKAEKIAQEYSSSLINELRRVYVLYEKTYTAYIKTYSQYESSEDSRLIPDLQEYERLLDQVGSMFTDVRSSMQNLHDLAIERLDRSDIADKLQEVLSLYE
jgi:tetratricopeptide (TPR) repeat protein